MRDFLDIEASEDSSGDDSSADTDNDGMSHKTDHPDEMNCLMNRKRWLY